MLLPNGVPMPVEMKASTSLYRNSRGTFFVMAMPSVWQTKGVSAPTRAEYLQGVFSHEMTHTRLLVDINRRVRELARKNDLVYPINDDVIQAEFRRTPGFEAAFNRERDQFYRAALETDPGKRRELAARALAMVRAAPRALLHRTDGGVRGARESLSDDGGSGAVGGVPPRPHERRRQRRRGAASRP